MNILYISHMFPNKINPVYGIFIQKLIKKIQAYGHKTIVISPVPLSTFPIKYFSKKWFDYSRIPLREKIDNIEIYHPRYIEFPKNLFLSSSGFRMYSGMKKIIKKILKKNKIDIIHSHAIIPDGYTGMLFSKEYNIPLIITIHGIDFFRKLKIDKIYNKKINEVINFSHQSIIVSKRLKNLGEKKFNLKKIIIIGNGVDRITKIKRNNNIKKKYINKIIITTVAQLIKRKAHFFMIEAISRLIKKYANLIYLIVGEGREKNNLIKQVKKNNSEDNIKFLGNKKHNHVLNIISNSDIFALPSWNESFGVVYIEAMSFGIPVIALKGEGMDGIIINKKTGILVSKKNIDSLVRSIEFLILNPVLAKKIGQKGKDYVLKNFTWDNIAKKTIDIYKKIKGK